MDIESSNNLANAELLGDIVGYDTGPLLSLYRAMDGDLYLMSWQDCTETENIWLWLSIETELAIQYLGGKVDLLECLKKAQRRFMKIESISKTTWKDTCFTDLKEADLPEAGYFVTDLADAAELSRLIKLLEAQTS